ncbi:hypothetical protein D9756_008322 [Leucocoprinus leucothites]|uniref:Uncharacterized protein n=1 Tax=Leucocoprinus leucothites TaxID=201217 RepID=A0A8H5D009_9AGAR|nr:hypothetical protein D9756_008322 [Leucoagaricus leucothites]
MSQEIYALRGYHKEYSGAAAVKAIACPAAKPFVWFVIGWVGPQPSDPANPLECLEPTALNTLHSNIQMAALLSPAWDTYLATSLAVGAPWLYFTFKGQQGPQQAQSDLSTSILLLAHTIYILYLILVAKPENVFNTFNLPINTSPDSIKALLLQSSEFGNIPGHLELLLKRLGSFDMRLLYVRFGHDAVATCEWCSSFEDFSLSSLPAALLAYIREAGIIGLLTLSSSKRGYLRPLGVGALVISCLTEFYWIATSTIQIPKEPGDEPTWMLHDQLLRYRHLLFLVLPLVIYRLPTIPIPIPILSSLLSPPVALSAEQKHQHFTVTLRTLEHLLPALHLTKYTKAAIMRTPELRDRANQWWDEEEKEGHWMLEDEGLKKTAKMAGLGFGEGSSGTGADDEPLRQSATIALRSLQEGAVPSEHWR